VVKNSAGFTYNWGDLKSKQEKVGLGYSPKHSW